MFKLVLKVVLLGLGLYLLTQEVPKLMHGARDSTTIVYTVMGGLLVFYTAGSVLKKISGRK